MERFPQRLSSGVGAVALEDNDEPRLQRRRNLGDLVWTLGDDRHILEEVLTFEIRRREPLGLEGHGNRVVRVRMSHRLRTAQRVDGGVQHCVARRRRAFVAAIGPDERDVALSKAPR